jgi:hypothetical protein
MTWTGNVGCVLEARPGKSWKHFFKLWYFDLFLCSLVQNNHCHVWTAKSDYSHSLGGSGAPAHLWPGFFKLPCDVAVQCQQKCALMPLWASVAQIQNVRPKSAASVSPSSPQKSSSLDQAWCVVSSGTGLLWWCLAKRLVRTFFPWVYQSHRANVKGSQICPNCWGVSIKALPGVSM